MMEKGEPFVLGLDLIDLCVHEEITVSPPCALLMPSGLVRLTELVSTQPNTE